MIAADSDVALHPTADTDCTVGCTNVPPPGVIVSPPGTSSVGSARKSPATTTSFCSGLFRPLAVAKNSDIGVFGVTSGPPTAVASSIDRGIW